MIKKSNNDIINNYINNDIKNMFIFKILYTVN